MPRVLLPVLALSVVLACGAAGAALAGGGEAVKGNEVSGAAVATEQKPAVVQVQDATTGGVAIEIKARPLGESSASPPYLVGVFANDQAGNAAPELLGSFSFFPPRAGATQTFVIPKSNIGEMSKGANLTLSIKLIPANPAADIKGAAVEILGARVIR